MTVSPLQGITHACFGLSYLVALVLELARLVWPRSRRRVARGRAGVRRRRSVRPHLYIAVHQPTPAAPYGSLLLLAWVLALFYLYGTVHHAKQAWAVFVLPVVIGLVGLSYLLLRSGDTGPAVGRARLAQRGAVLGAVHGLLILLAAVGVSVGFLASVMYLVQARRLRNKVNPGRVVPLLSLERLETMNRRALNLAFPLLTAGLLVGLLICARPRRRRQLAVAQGRLHGRAVGRVPRAALPALRRARPAAPAGGALDRGLRRCLLVALAAAHPFATGGTQ